MKCMTHAPITAVILHKNAPDMLERALVSVQWCRDILILDDCSQSLLAPLAKKYHATVYTRQLTSFADQRNFALHKATQPWVFFLDADETVSKALQQEIRHAICSSHRGFLIPRQDTFLGKTLRFGETRAITFLRLAQKDVGQWSRIVHERWDVQGSVGVLHTSILHTPHQSISAFIDKINMYTQLEISERKLCGKTFSWFELFVYPCAKFIHNYVVRGGWRDGFPGFCMAYMMSLHSLVVRIKMYET